MELFGYIGALAMGLLLGLIGGGGSILSVPIFVFLFKIEPVIATSYSLFVVGLSALAGSITYFKQKLVQFKTGLLFGIPSFLGVFLVRKYLVPALPTEIFSLFGFVITKNILIMMVFAILMIAASYSMIKGSSGQKSQSSTLTKNKKILLIAFEGLIVGSVTGFVGAGGGFLIIPALVILVGLPMKEAIGTSLMIIALKSLFGFLGDLQNVAMDWKFLITFSLISLVGIVIGTKLNSKINEAKLKKLFGYFVLAMGLFIISSQL